MSVRNLLGAVVAIGALAACDASRPGVTDPTMKAPASGRRDVLALSGAHQPSLSGVVTATPYGSALGAMSQPADASAVRRSVGVGPNLRVHSLSYWPRDEATISVDGMDSRRLVAAANDYSNVPVSGDSSCGNYASTDGGARWHDVGTGYQPVGLSAGGDPATAFDANGTAYFVCLSFDRRGASGIFVAKSRDLLTVTPMTPVIMTAGSTGLFNDKEFVAIDTRDDSRYQGRIYVTWTQFKYRPDGRYVRSPILISYSSNGGATWSVPRAVTPPDLSSDQGSVPAVGPNGELLVAFENFDTPTINLNQVMVARSLDGGRTFERPVKVDDLFDVCPRVVDFQCLLLEPSSFRVNSFPSIAAGDDGTAHVVWNDYRNGKAEIRYSQSSNGGRRWSASSLVSPNRTSGDQFFPWVTTDDDGRAQVVYYDRRDDPNNYLLNTYMSSQRGGGFGKAVRVTDVSSDPLYDGFGGFFIGDYNGIAAGGGKAHPIWTDTRRYVVSDAMTATVELGTGPRGAQR